jgi:uncharacterized membrane protein
MANGTLGQELDNKRITYGFCVVVIGFLVVLSAFAIAVWKDAKDVTTLLSAIIGIVGSLAGTFFGVHVGAAGKEQAESERRDMQRRLINLAASATPDVAKGAMNLEDGQKSVK